MLMTDPFADLVPKAPSGPVYGPTPKPEKPDKPNLPVGMEMGPDGVARVIKGVIVKSQMTDGEAASKATQDLSAGFYGRALASHQAYGEGMGPRGAAAQTMVDMLPQNWTNPHTNPKRRAAQNYIEEFIRAKLRKESGAAIPDPEMARE